MSGRGSWSHIPAPLLWKSHIPLSYCCSSIDTPHPVPNFGESCFSGALKSWIPHPHVVKITLPDLVSKLPLVQWTQVNAHQMSSVLFCKIISNAICMPSGTWLDFTTVPVHLGSFWFFMHNLTVTHSLLHWLFWGISRKSVGLQRELYVMGRLSLPFGNFQKLLVCPERKKWSASGPWESDHGPNDFTGSADKNWITLG